MPVGVLPEKGLSAEAVLEALRSIAAGDMDPRSGRMLGHSYETGLEELRVAVLNAYEMFFDKNMLDFTVYPSVLKLEQEVVEAAAELLHAPPGAVGSFTYGGTESIMLAVKSARDWFWRRHPGVRPRLVMPHTGHPAFAKASDYLGLELVRVRVDPETLKADVNAVLEAVDEKTAMVALSAPNYPYGTVDPIREVAEGLEGRVWLHVDACMGGFVLPFMEELGEPVPPFDFRVDGVYSISSDLHKYGYAPKGASVVLYRDRELRRGQLYVYLSWPGYPFVNEAVLSSRSAGTLAASWAVLMLLGREGYLELTRRILEARSKISSGLARLGFQVLPTDSSLLAFTADGVSLPALAKAMRRRGWYVQFEPGLPDEGLPAAVHLTIAPIHANVAEAFLESLASAYEEARSAPRGRARELLSALSEPQQLFEAIGLREGELPSNLDLVDELLEILPRDVAQELLREAVDLVLSPRRGGSTRGKGS
ncbi:MAG: aspartate aminotransferase family protein [Thermoproteota archaeon]